MLKEELEAALEARKELGEEMEPAVIDAFVARVEQRLGDRAGEDERALKRERDHQKEMVPADHRPSALAASIAARPGSRMRPAAISASALPTLIRDHGLFGRRCE